MIKLHKWNRWIGTDEAGKGDYFGPLVVAGVYVDPECRDEFLEMGITDGKKIANSRICKLADWMWKHYEQHIEVEQKMPDKYNAQYDEYKKRGENSSRILAELHIKVIETLAKRMAVKHALVDKFPYNDLTRLLTQRDITIKLETKAERDVAVAAASIIARDRFLKGIETLSNKYSYQLPRGANQVIDAGKEFVSLNGENSLRNVAKLHFRTTKSVLS